MRQTVRFLLGNDRVELHEVDPTQTILQFLREERHRKGTKEGCAEGDCGACSVVIGRPKYGDMHYEAVNACIRFTATLDGCQLLTVEDLVKPDGSLHQVQRAMVDCHGSQCGFCTPGFVMSIFALGKTKPEPSLAEINDALAGNLCRCTGYGPIIDAARKAGSTRDEDAEREVYAQLRALDDGAAYQVEKNGRAFCAPTTLDEAQAFLNSHPDATILAGGTDVGLWVTKLNRKLTSVLWLGRMRDLDRVEVGDESIEIGAGATYSDAIDVLGEHFGDAGELVRRIGSVQIRNAGTMGGNVANGSPIGDMPPFLIAAGATIELCGKNGPRELPIEDFFLAYGRQSRTPDEILTKIRVPRLTEDVSLSTYKISKRFDQDISALSAAFYIKLKKGIVREARLAFGGMAGIPKRASAAEAALNGEPFTRNAVELAAAALGRDFTPLTDMRASADYRLKVAGNLLRKCYLEIDEGEPLNLAVSKAGRGQREANG